MNSVGHVYGFTVGEGKNAEASKMANAYWPVGMCDVFSLLYRVGHGR